MLPCAGCIRTVSVFMAFTLVLVSFSCTAPIVGTVLVEAARGSVLRPIIGMLVILSCGCGHHTSLLIAVPIRKSSLQILKGLLVSGFFLRRIICWKKRGGDNTDSTPAQSLRAYPAEMCIRDRNYWGLQPFLAAPLVLLGAIKLTTSSTE